MTEGITNPQRDITLLRNLNGHQGFIKIVPGVDEPAILGINDVFSEMTGMSSNTYACDYFAMLTFHVIASNEQLQQYGQQTVALLAAQHIGSCVVNPRVAFITIGL